MKKILLIALFNTILVGSSFADAPSPVFNGFYLGGGVTYSNERIKTKASYTVGGVSGSTSTTEAFRGAGVKLFCGYGIFLYQNVYLGGELGLGIDRILGDNKSKIIESGNNVNYSVTARLGYGISNIMPYVKLGYDGRPSMKAFNTFTVNRNGYIAGGGVDVALYVNVFVRAEYVHGFGAKSSIAGQGTFLVVPLSAQGKAKTSSDTFLIGAAYKF